ncbi:MAG: D-glycero-beta-D-manno-heptose 1-phosphate adenylyltransferase [Pirellulaceae bacterium]|nr:D-glycero-beta-D-manno-heptose 1-phosphate adenylyltransferase [Pirellulaceae bacterium]
MNLLNSLSRIQQPKIMVLGDLMLDQYTWGTTNRTSQEAPVMVLQVQKREHRLGGASNVCHMLQVLGSNVTCAGVIGADAAGKTLIELLAAADINTELVLQCEERLTTQKERFVGNSGSGLPGQLLRVDTEATTAISPQIEQRLIEGLIRALPGHDALLISDYAKGACTEKCVQAAIHAAKDAEIPILVDPGRCRDFSIYRHATLIKPNRTETEEATQSGMEHPEDAMQAGKKLCQQYDFEMAVITLDADGMALVPSDGAGEVYSTKARSVFDITGAGDMVLSVLGLCLGSGLPPEESVQLANIAAGIVVDRTGVCTILRDEIRSELTAQRNSLRKQVTLDQAAQFAEESRRRGQRVVFTNGCFDLLHVGHVTYLEEAASHGEALIVGVNSDTSVRRLKGPQRPIISEEDRVAMLASLACVSRVIIFDEDTPHQMLQRIQPDVLVKGGTYQPHEVVGREVVESYGGRVSVTRVLDGVSTTRIVESLSSPGQKPSKTRSSISPGRLRHAS